MSLTEDTNVAVNQIVMLLDKTNASSGGVRSDPLNQRFRMGYISDVNTGNSTLTFTVLPHSNDGMLKSSHSLDGASKVENVVIGFNSQNHTLVSIVGMPDHGSELSMGHSLYPAMIADRNTNGSLKLYKADGSAYGVATTRVSEMQDGGSTLTPSFSTLFPQDPNATVHPTLSADGSALTAATEHHIMEQLQATNGLVNSTVGYKFKSLGADLSNMETVFTTTQQLLDYMTDLTHVTINAEDVMEITDFNERIWRSAHIFDYVQQRTSINMGDSVLVKMEYVQIPFDSFVSSAHPDKGATNSVWVSGKIRGIHADISAGSGVELPSMLIGSSDNNAANHDGTGFWSHCWWNCGISRS